MFNQSLEKWTAIDLFAGAGGVSTGLLESGCVDIKVAINHDEAAIMAHKQNHPKILHLMEDVTNVKKILPLLPEVDLLWASAECTNHSNAKGGQSRDADSRSLPEFLPQYVKKTNCKVFIVENVVEFMMWGTLCQKRHKETGKKMFDKNKNPIMMQDPKTKGVHYNQWVQSIKDLGYEYTYKVVNSADHGVATKRKRYFGVFYKPDMLQDWPEPTHNEFGTDGLRSWMPCKDHIDLDLHGTSIFGRTMNMALPSHRRKDLSIKTYDRVGYGAGKYCIEGDPIGFIIKYYNSKHNVSSIDKPLHTITGNDRMAMIHFIQYAYGRPDASSSINQPANTITTCNRVGLVSASLVKQWVDKRQYGGHHVQSLDEPAHTITCKARFCLASAHFLTQNIHGSPSVSSVDKPSGTILTRDEKALITTDMTEQFLSYKNSGKSNVGSIDSPMNVIPTKDWTAMISLGSSQYVVNKQSGPLNVSGLGKPFKAITAHEWSMLATLVTHPQFLAKKYSDRTQVQGLAEPFHTITATTQNSLISLEDQKPEEGQGDLFKEEWHGAFLEQQRYDKYMFFNHYFPKPLADILVETVDDIKMRYLSGRELADITGFPKDYFLGKSETKIKKHVGNAVPPRVPCVIVQKLFEINNPVLANMAETA